MQGFGDSALRDLRIRGHLNAAKLLGAACKKTPFNTYFPGGYVANLSLGEIYNIESSSCSDYCEFYLNLIANMFPMSRLLR